MESLNPGWWRRHGWTVAILLTAFGITFLIRSLWMIPVLQQYGQLYVYGGGSDSYYHSRVMQYIILNHSNLVLDPLLRYPLGAINPREPLFDWMNAILGLVFAPLFGGSAVNAGAFFLNASGPIWSALSVFPIYLIGREVSSKRTGLIAALLFPFIVADINSSTLGYANYLAFYTFFILIVLYSFLRTVKAVSSRRYVESYRHPKQFIPALKQFYVYDHTAVKWAVFTGVAFGGLTLAWQGYTYAVATIAIFIVFAMIVERVRRVDSFGLYVSTWIVGLVGFPMAVPYYWFQHEFAGWFDLPLLLFFGALLLLLPFLLMRDIPWVFSIPALIGIVLLGLIGLAVFAPTYFTNIVTGQGYFVKTLVYSTVAEAQAPSVDQLILGYGVATFFLAFVGLVLFVIDLVRGRFKRWHMLFLVFAVLDLYLPITAAKFFLIGSPAFALLPAEALRRTLDIGGYPELRRNVASLSDRRSQATAFRKAFKARHIAILVVVVLVVLPNIWYSIDAGIPYNTKTQVGNQITNTLPGFLQPSASLGSSAYLGASGTSLDTPVQYDEAGYNWLAQQDTNLPEPQRPAFISWWDYGFQAVDQGQHPTVADNFQNGITPGGAFLLSQNESQAIGVLATELLASEQVKSGDPYLPPALNAILAKEGLNLAELHTLLVNTTNDVALVIAHPELYLPVVADELSPLNAMYMTMEVFLASSLPISGVAQVYNSIQAYTGWTIRYGMVDSRLFPFSGSDTGIFYAPAELTNRVIAADSVPTTFYNVTVLGSDGNTYPAGETPADVQPVQYNINYFAPFYDSMLYHIYIGYNGTQIGLSGGIPGLTGAAENSPIEPGWMLQHFQIVYKTAYYCDNATQQNNSNCLVAMNLPDAVALAKSAGGVALTSPSQYFGGGETMLEYYPGQPMIGTIQLPNGAPVSGARVTVYDSWGIPHMSTVTNAQGDYSVVLPPGQDTVNVSSGALDALTQSGSLVLKSLSIYVSPALGMSFDAPQLNLPITLAPAKVGGFFYWNTANNSTYVPDSDPLVSGASVELWGSGLPSYATTTDTSGSYSFSSIAPGVYNSSVVYQGANFSQPLVYASPGKVANQTQGLNPGTITGAVRNAQQVNITGATVTLTGRNGVIANTVSNSSGGYTLKNFGPGVYNVTATLAGTNLRSPAITFQITSPGQVVRTNLTLAPTQTVTFPVTWNGYPVPNFPVRFTLLPGIVNATTSPLTPLRAAAANSSLFWTNSAGVVSATLALGNYSVYSSGYIGTTQFAGFTDIYPSSTTPTTFPAFALGTALRLTGSVATAGPIVSNTTTVVNIYDSSGATVSTWTDANGTYGMLLPAGTYSLYALQGATTKGATIYAALATVALTYGRSVALDPVVATPARFVVGLPNAGSPNGLFPATNATVTVGLGTGGAAWTSVASTAGNVSLYVPSTLPVGASYCLSTRALGFVAQQQCGLTPSGLTAITQVSMSLASVPVTVTFTGYPTNLGLRVNFTALSPTGNSQTFIGGPTFTFSALPGTYRITAAAPASPSGLYLTGQVTNVTVPLGASGTLFNVRLVAQIISRGTLSLPAGVANTSVSVRLSSPTVNTTITGKQYEQGFYARASTIYTAFATAPGTNNSTYVSLSRVTINATGSVTSKIILTTLGIAVSGNLTLSSGMVLNATTPVTFESPTGGTVTVLARDGSFSLHLPPSLNYGVALNTTVLISAEGGQTAYQSFTTKPGYTCAVGRNATSCAISLVSTTLLTWLNGTVSALGIPYAFSGTLSLYGPFPSANVTRVAVTNGTFAAELLPGVYVAYPVVAEGGFAYANLTSVVATPLSQDPVALFVRPTWSSTVTLLPPASGSAQPATLSIADILGRTIFFPSVPYASPVSVPLPAGVYTVRATATGTPYGVAANANASAVVSLLHGNAATTLTLAYVFHPKVNVTIQAPTSVTVPATGGPASFAYVVTNVGDSPVQFYLGGSPAFWGFTFSTQNVTLGVLPGTNSVGGEVVITVPAGTVVDHPAVTIQALLTSNNSVIGSSSPYPKINVEVHQALGAGGASSLPPSLAPTKAEIPFYVVNQGNILETVLLTISDASRLLGLGWNSSLLYQGTTLTAPQALTPQANHTFFVVLNATSTVFVPPGSVTVTATLVNTSTPLSQSVVLKVPIAPLNVNRGILTVTGPSIGAAPATPDWLVPVLVFLPAIALLAGVFIIRWLRTRRWTRR
jgi:asparagine N-glycosylation enzyme membrane subunit Stt3